MEQEPDIGGADQPATKADIRLLKADIRNLRTWAEGKFEAIDQKFEALRQEMRALIAERFREFQRRMLRYFVGFYFAQVVALYALLRAV